MIDKPRQRENRTGVTESGALTGVEKMRRPAVRSHKRPRFLPAFSAWVRSVFACKLNEQLTGDDGCAPVLCPFKSRVIGVGPQIGYIFPVAGMQGYVNLKGYGEFDNDNRPDGWNVWLTFVLSPAPPSSESSPPPMLTKTPRS